MDNIKSLSLLLLYAFSALAAVGFMVPFLQRLFVGSKILHEINKYAGKVSIASIVVLLALSGYLLYMTLKFQERIDFYEKKYSIASIQNKNLQGELYKNRALIDSIIVRLAEAEIIGKDLDENHSIEVLEKSILMFKEKYNEQRSLVVNKQRRIDELIVDLEEFREENSELIASNNELNWKFNLLRDSINNLQFIVAEGGVLDVYNEKNTRQNKYVSSSLIDSLQYEIVQLRTNNNNLILTKKDVEALKIQDLKIVPEFRKVVNVKRGERLAYTDDNIKRFLVNFKMEWNEKSPFERTENIYVIYRTPTGVVDTDKAGVKTINGKKLKYSLNFRVLPSDNGQMQGMYYELKKYEPGMHNIEFYGDKGSIQNISVEIE